jgi:hypothetical protein
MALIVLRQQVTNVILHALDGFLVAA